MNTKLNTFLWLLWRDIRALRKTFFNQWLDYSCLLTITVLLNNYVMPTFGLPATFGVYMLISQAVANLLWVITADCGAWAYDLQGTKAISYELTLPISHQLVYLKYACAFAIKALIINITSLPVAALVIAKSIDVGAISWGNFLIAFALSSVFFALFNLCVVVLYNNVETYNRFWMRWGMIIWMFSGLFSPWYIINKSSIYAGYATLCNPLLYAYEATHAAFMGQGQFINFWICIVAMIGFGIVFTVGGVYLFKKRLDCV